MLTVSPPSFDGQELHLPPPHLSSDWHSPSPRKPPSEQSGFPSVSEPLVTWVNNPGQYLTCDRDLKRACSHLLAAIVFLVLDSQYLSSFFSEQTNCLALLRIIGCGLSSSMSKARALGSKSAPGTVAKARSWHLYSLKRCVGLIEKIPRAQTQSQLPSSSASPPFLSPAWLALTLCRGSHAFALEHLVSLCLRVVGHWCQLRW